MLFFTAFFKITRTANGTKNHQSCKVEAPPTLLRLQCQVPPKYFRKSRNKR